MKISIKSALLGLACCTSHLLFGQTGFRPLFDGESLQGWEGSADYWRVEEGAIVGEIPEGQRLEKNHWLIWKGGDVGNFELRLRFKLAGNPRANSGIQFRCQAKGINEVSGYQADLDMGEVWLGRIYDEHGRKLLVERGVRVEIGGQGERREETFSEKDLFHVLFRENEWNDYRIVACDEYVSVYVNGTLFSQLIDRERGERDLTGQLAFQLHSGGPMKIRFTDVRLREIESGGHSFGVAAQSEARAPTPGIVPLGLDGKPMNLGFETGDLSGWTVDGEAFALQPTREDNVPSRWPGQASNKEGEYFLSGFENDGSAKTGKLISDPFKVQHRWASFLVGGGDSLGCRVEVVLNDGSDKIIESFRGHDREQMERVYFDLNDYLGEEVFVRIVDLTSRGWGIVNYDDFRFYAVRPHEMDDAAVARVRKNPILAHLAPNPHRPEGNGSETVGSMSVTEGFSVDIIAAEPDLHQPIAFTFDEKGRIWVIEAHSYPLKRDPGQGMDKIVIFEDKDADGSYESRKVFYKGLNLASGIEVGFGGVWVGAAPELLFIPDENGDDRPDGDPVVLLDGFGYQDTHETLNSFLWGPDGWLYGIQGIFNTALIGKPGAEDDEREWLTAGVWRYHPTRHAFEIFAHGGSNPWGLDFNEMGQMFMTHCRSRWGGGATTQVIQNGHFWKQSNRGYADFVSGEAPEGHPHYRNFMLASSRYGWGEGGAGKKGSRAVYGGHSPVGAMFYLGDNWPEQYRDHLFSHNLHGHQMNHQVNVPEGSGYNTLHAGFDMLYVPEPTYVGVELKYGPDGSVIFSDWVDLQHCHNPRSEQWDRGNGRLYRMAWADTFQPVKVNLRAAGDEELTDYLLHPNDWYARTARRLLQERAARSRISGDIRDSLVNMATRHDEVSRRLRGLWALHAIGWLTDGLAMKCLSDESEYVRAWTIQLLTGDRDVSGRLQGQLAAMARKDPSAVVRLYLASAIPRVGRSTAWKLAESLAMRAEDKQDRYLPKMVWYALGGLMESDPGRVFKIAGRSPFKHLSDYANWYGAKIQGKSMDRVLRRLDRTDDPENTMEAIALALEGQRDLEMPNRWKRVSDDLYSSDNDRVAKLSRQVGALFGDRSIYPRMREVLADPSEPMDDRRDAFEILSTDNDPETPELLLSLLDDPGFRLEVIELAARLDHPEVAPRLINGFNGFDVEERAAAVNALTKRETLAVSLLDAIEEGQISRKHLNAYHARELSLLKSKAVNQRLERIWGRVQTTPAEVRAKIDKLDTFYSEAPLWAFSASTGQSHFKALCASCHQPNDTGISLGPDLTGSGANGVRYFLENIIDPNAVVGSDYELTIVETQSGQIVSGMIENESDSAVTIRTLTDTFTLARSDIKNFTKLPQSMMPPGLLDSLNETQQVELLKYLSSL